MYKKLLDKGFTPVYYTNDDWFESRKCNSRLFYRYRVETKELINSIFNVLGIFDRYFFIIEAEDVVVEIEAEDVVVEIEADEELKEYWIYFYNAMTDNYDIPSDKLNDVFNVLPNKFEFEYSE